MDKSLNLILFMNSTSQQLTGFDTEKLMYLKADVNYTVLHFENGNKHIYGYTLKRFEALLASNSLFVRIHRSVIVNRGFINSFEDKNVIMRGGERFPLARRRKLISQKP